MLAFDSAADLMAHYDAVRMRLRGPAPKTIVFRPPPRVEPEPEPEPVAPPLPNPMIKISTFVATQGEIRISFEEVTALVCKHTDYHRREIFAARRHHHICYSRQLLWALARRFCWHMSLPQIGRVSGNRDHTTILHGCKKGVMHPLFNELCQVLENLYEEKRQANEALIVEATAECGGGV